MSRLGATPGYIFNFGGAASASGAGQIVLDDGKPRADNGLNDSRYNLGNIRLSLVMHYHGTPITPRSVLYSLAGCNFCVSYHHPQDIRVAHEIGQSVMLDNGAFSAWTRGITTDWSGYYTWCETWLRYHTTWAVIPDVIDGTEEDNDSLISDWPHGDRGAPVWHVHESITRLARLCRDWRRVCIGSSGEYRGVGTPKWHRRMSEVFNQVGNPCWLHMLRGLSLSGTHYPFASVDSTDIARNHKRGCAVKRAKRWDGLQNPSTWNKEMEQCSLLTKWS